MVQQQEVSYIHVLRSRL